MTSALATLLYTGCFAEPEPLEPGTSETGDASEEDGAGATSTIGSSTAAESTSTSTDATTSTSESSDDAGDETSGAALDMGTETSGGAVAYEPCAAAGDCAADLFCLLADYARGGYCTATCVAHEECEGYPMLKSGVTISCAGSWGPSGETACVLSCFQDPPGECPAGTSCGTHDYDGESYGGLCG